MMPPLALLTLLGVALAGTAQGAEAPDNPLMRLDDPIFRIGFKPRVPFATLNEAIQKGISRRPGLLRYSAFEAKVDPNLPDLELPGGFTGTFEQLIKTIACLNNVSYRDFSPAGVTFVRTSPMYPMPRCPREDTEEEALAHARQPLPGSGFTDLQKRLLRPRPPTAAPAMPPTIPAPNEQEHGEQVP